MISSRHEIEKKSRKMNRVAKKRIAWLDIAKLLGMVAIFVGHLSSKSNNALVQWVFAFHVPLFFFLAGCAETMNKRKIIPNFFHKIKTIIIPLYVFAFITILFTALSEGGAASIHAMRNQFFEGFIRNHGFGALWFLSCLFVVEILFSVIKKTKKWYFIFAISCALFCIAYYLIKPWPAISPSWWWNVDSAFLYVPFFAIGYILFPLVKKSYESRKKIVTAFRNIVGIACLCYLSSIFVGKSIFARIESINEITAGIMFIVKPLLCIMAILYVAKLLENVTYLSKIGKCTLYLCGGEYVAKELLIHTSAALFGNKITTQFEAPIQAYIFAIITMALAFYVLKPIFSYFIEKIQSIKQISKW